MEKLSNCELNRLVSDQENWAKITANSSDYDILACLLELKQLRAEKEQNGFSRME